MSMSDQLSMFDLPTWSDTDNATSSPESVSGASPFASPGGLDERPVWTGSCPCQPFSAAGKGGGFVDDRHLWPEFFRLIGERRPDTILGEQVASKDGLGWLDLVCADLEGADYACGSVDTCAAGFGAPHIRQRLFWIGVGNA